MKERAGLSDASTGIYDTAARENRDVTTDEQAQLDAWETRSKSLDSEIARLETAARGAQRFQQIAGRVDELDEGEERQAARRRETERPPETPLTVGAQFIASDAFKEYQGSGTSRRVDFGGFIESRAAIMTGDLNIPAIPVTPPSPTYSAPLLNVIGHEYVAGGAVSFITWGDVSDAAVVPEGEVKPEATLTPVETTVGLKTYAHYKGITRQALEDYPRIQSIVEGELRRGLTNALSAAAAAALGLAAFEEVNDSDLLKGIRIAAGEVQQNGYTPNAVILNPADWANLDVDTAIDSNNGPTAYSTYWGLTPIPNPAQAVGTAEVGDFRSALTWFDRNTTSVYLTDSHADFFIRNTMLILAETRAAFEITDVRAAVSVTTAVVPLASKSSK
jgi:HK97 family phage major capsid protein